MIITNLDFPIKKNLALVRSLLLEGIKELRVRIHLPNSIIITQLRRLKVNITLVIYLDSQYPPSQVNSKDEKNSNKFQKYEF